MISSSGDRDGVQPKIKRFALDAGVQIALMPKCPIWGKKKGRWDSEGFTSKGKGAKGQGGGESGQLACLGEEEIDPRKAEISENEANYACRNINLANVTGGMIGKEKLGKRTF